MFVYSGALPAKQNEFLKVNNPKSHKREWSHLSHKSFNSLDTENPSTAIFPAIFYTFDDNCNPKCDFFLI
jgi:hypothetical protein